MAKHLITVVALTAIIAGCGADRPMVSSEYTVSHYEELGGLGGPCRNGVLTVTWLRSQEGTMRYVCGRPYEIGHRVTVMEHPSFNYNRQRLWSESNAE